MAHIAFDYEQYHKDSQVTDVLIEDVQEEGNYQADDPRHRSMKAAMPTTYDFIPHDDTHEKHEGMCVFDTFLGVYGDSV